MVFHISVNDLIWANTWKMLDLFCWKTRILDNLDYTIPLCFVIPMFNALAISPFSFVLNCLAKFSSMNLQSISEAWAEIHKWRKIRIQFFIIWIAVNNNVGCWFQYYQGNLISQADVKLYGLHFHMPSLWCWNKRETLM